MFNVQKKKKGVPYPSFTNISEEMSRFFKPKGHCWQFYEKALFFFSPLQFYWDLIDMGASLVAQWEFACSAGDVGSIPGSGRSPRGGHRNLLQDSCLENPMDRGTWWAMVHRVAELDITEATEHTHTHSINLRCIA